MQSDGKGGREGWERAAHSAGQLAFSQQRGRRGGRARPPSTLARCWVEQAQVSQAMAAAVVALGEVRPVLPLSLTPLLGPGVFYTPRHEVGRGWA